MAGSLSPEKGVRDEMNVCQLCGALDNLSLCGGCRDIWYCCKDHQRNDWKAHKKLCKKTRLKTATIDTAASASEVQDSSEHAMKHNNNKALSSSNIIVNMQKESTIQNMGCGDTVNKLSNVTLHSDVKSSECTSDVSVSVDSHNLNSSQLKGECDSTEMSKNKEVPVPVSVSNIKPSNTNSRSVASESVKLKNTNLKKSHIGRSNNHGNKQHKYEKQGNFPDGFLPERHYLDPSTHKIILPSSLREAVSRQASDERDNTVLSPKHCREQYLSVLDTRFEQLAIYVVDSLLKHGICVIDKFLGEITGQEIFNEVIKLEKDGIMKQGQLVQGTSSTSNTYIRGDVITWVDGTDKNTENIHFLISCMDAVMMKSTVRLKQNTIDERTKAMVACYPGKKTRYVRHVDNPSGDGRCITSIYYLNKDWDIRVHGGLLRIYPEGKERVANIEPLFDRLLFFWSDRRNPHEVEESFKERYAITVWYYDAEERAEALKQFKGRSDTSSAKSQHTTSSNGD